MLGGRHQHDFFGRDKDSDCSAVGADIEFFGQGEDIASSMVLIAHIDAIKNDGSSRKVVQPTSRLTGVKCAY